MKSYKVWLPYISFGFNLLLSALGLYQFLDAQKMQSNKQIMIRSWQNDVEGLKNGLLSIAQNPQGFSSVNDMSQAVNVSAQSAVALNQAISQERFYTDEEVRKQKESEQLQFKIMMDEYSKKQNTSFSTSSSQKK